MMFELREPFSALSHGAGLLLALPVTWVLWRRCPEGPGRRAKRLALLIFGISLMACYGGSAAYHGACVDAEALSRLRRLDHVGIYLLIAGTYTPGAWTLLSCGLRRRTLATVWTVAAVCSARVWIGGTLPVWTSTAIYLAMGWGVLACYRELVRNHGHRRLLPLPLGGVFYSVGAIINLAGWPALHPGLFGAHELFHLFVLAGSACHVGFMLKVVIPTEPAADVPAAGFPTADVPAAPWPPDPAWSGVGLRRGRGLEVAPEANAAA
jgi:hemolysin III